MRKIVIDDIAQVSAEMIAYNSIEGHGCVAIGCYEVIVEILNTIIKNTSATFVNGELKKPDVDGYEDAYYIEYYEDELWLGKIYSELHKAYILIEADKVWVEEEFLDDYLNVNDAENVTVFSFDAADEDASKVPCLCLDDDELGFTCCYSDEDGHGKFKYRGSEKITKEKAWDIVHDYLEF